MGYYHRLYKLPKHIQEELHSKFPQPFTISVIEYGERIAAWEIAADTKTFTDFKGHITQDAGRIRA